MDYGPDKVIVLDATPADCISIRQLALDADIDAWSEADYSDEIARRDSFMLKAVYRDTLAGFLLARIVPGSDDQHPDADLYNIGVSLDHRRHGVGTLLLLTLFERLIDTSVECLWLEVRESNAEAISFYEHHGFKAEVTRPNFYSNPNENAVIMRLQIRPGRHISEV